MLIHMKRSDVLEPCLKCLLQNKVMRFVLSGRQRECIVLHPSFKQYKFKLMPKWLWVPVKVQCPFFPNQLMLVLCISVSEVPELC